MLVASNTEISDGKSFLLFDKKRNIFDDKS